MDNFYNVNTDVKFRYMKNFNKENILQKIDSFRELIASDNYAEIIDTVYDFYGEISYYTACIKDKNDDY